MCRSPMAEGLFRQRSLEAGIEVDIASCGLLEGGRPCPPSVFTVMDPRGVDLHEHLAQPLTPQLVQSSRLILGMERQHVREAVVLAPGSFGRTFTLRDFVWRAQQVGPRGHRPLDEWLAEVGEGRRTTDLLGSDTLDEVPDPMGGPVRAFEEAAEELDHLTRVAFELLLGELRSAGSSAAIDDSSEVEVVDLSAIRQQRARAPHPVVTDTPSFGLGAEPPVTPEGDPI